MAKKANKKKRRCKGKGSSFERTLCRQLSLWWTHGNRDDVFWRTAGSGAMATTRIKKQRASFGQHGDIQAVDPIGQPLLDVFSIEAKRGYTGATLSNILDAGPQMKPQLVKFIEQARTSQLESGAWSWLLIRKRDQRHTTVLFPFYVVSKLSLLGLDHISFRSSNEIGGTKRIIQIKLDDFLNAVPPKRIRKIGKSHDK